MFTLLKQEGAARRGQFETVHGTIQTPVFMNVGTSAAIKGGISSIDLKNELKTQVELCNTYHLHIRPGDGSAFRWTLTDISGKVLQTGEANGETTVDTRSCAPGLYLLQVNANGKTGVSKVVIR